MTNSKLCSIDKGTKKKPSCTKQVVKCPICFVLVKTGGILCTNCQEWVHLKCAGLTYAKALKVCNVWKCEFCTNNHFDDSIEEYLDNKQAVIQTQGSQACAAPVLSTHQTINACSNLSVDKNSNNVTQKRISILEDVKTASLQWDDDDWGNSPLLLAPARYPSVNEEWASSTPVNCLPGTLKDDSAQSFDAIKACYTPPSMTINQETAPNVNSSLSKSLGDTDTAPTPSNLKLNTPRNDSSQAQQLLDSATAANRLVVLQKETDHKSDAIKRYYTCKLNLLSIDNKQLSKENSRLKAELSKMSWSKRRIIGQLKNINEKRLKRHLKLNRLSQIERSLNLAESEFVIRHFVDVVRGDSNNHSNKPGIASRLEKTECRSNGGEKVSKISSVSTACLINPAKIGVPEERKIANSNVSVNNNVIKSTVRKRRKRKTKKKAISKDLAPHSHNDVKEIPTFQNVEVDSINKESEERIENEVNESFIVSVHEQLDLRNRYNVLASENDRIQINSQVSPSSVSESSVPELVIDKSSCKGNDNVEQIHAHCDRINPSAPDNEERADNITVSTKKVFFLGDSHIRFLEKHFSEENYVAVTGYKVLPGYKINDILIPPNIPDLSNSDYLIISAGANDLYVNQHTAMQALYDLKNFIKNNQEFNIAVLGIPYRFDYFLDDKINLDIYTFNLELKKLSFEFEHCHFINTSMLNGSHYNLDRIHLNRAGKVAVIANLVKQLGNNFEGKQAYRKNGEGTVSNLNS